MRIACLLTVTDVFVAGVRHRLEDEGIALAAERLGRVAAAALAPDAVLGA
jgi:hypothetical protein